VKRLLLLRHAKAAPPQEALADFARPLAERGERDARRMAERMRQHGLRPEWILASPAARAQRTAQHVAAAFDYPDRNIALDARLYLADPDELTAVIGTQEPAIANLLVVGHNPGLTDFTRTMLPEVRIDELPTSGLIAIDLPIDLWANLPGASGQLVCYDYPKNLGAPITTR
jgi:phosphohistidine phosphatase